MNVLVTGASGFLGRTILERGKDILQIVGTHFTDPYDETSYLDITNKDLVDKILFNSKTEIVVHCASLRNSIAEKNLKLANAINVQGTKNITDSCKKYGIHLIYISSDSVFDGTEKINDENTKTNPLGIFGKHKMQCENMISENLSSYCIIRTSLLFGWDDKQLNFVQWVVSELKKNHELKIISDQYVSPSYCKNMADVILESAQKKTIGLYHASGRECLTRFNFAIKIAKIFHLDEKLLVPTSLNDLDLNMKRGKNCCLDISKLLSTFNTHIVSLDQALLEMYDNQPLFKV